MTTRQKIEFPSLPLAVYREVAAHLRQVEGTQVGLITQSSQEFDYNQSQIEGLWIEYTSTATQLSREKVEEILEYYRRRYNG